MAEPTLPFGVVPFECLERGGELRVAGFGQEMTAPCEIESHVEQDELALVDGPDRRQAAGFGGGAGALRRAVLTSRRTRAVGLRGWWAGKSGRVRTLQLNVSRSPASSAVGDDEEVAGVAAGDGRRGLAG